MQNNFNGLKPDESYGDSVCARFSSSGPGNAGSDQGQVLPRVPQGSNPSRCPSAASLQHSCSSSKSRPFPATPFHIGSWKRDNAIEFGQLTVYSHKFAFSAVMVLGCSDL